MRTHPTGENNRSALPSASEHTPLMGCEGDAEGTQPPLTAHRLQKMPVGFEFSTASGKSWGASPLGKAPYLC
jgi:hypothetical protein